MSCEEIALEELKLLRDNQRLLQALVIAILGNLDSVNLEEVL